MNRLLFIARSVKNLTPLQVARVLKVTEAEYKEFEHSLKDLTAQQAVQLGKLFGIEAEWFFHDNGRRAIVIKEMSQEVWNIAKEIQPENGNSALMNFKIVHLGFTALAAQAELKSALLRQMELELDNKALREIISDLSA